MREEDLLAEERMSKFLTLLDMYFEIIKGRVNHSRVDNWVSVLIEVIYSYFYSIIDDRDDSINVFRIWKQQYPEHTQQIDAVETEVQPHKQYFLLFRNNVGFHGAVSRKGHIKGMSLFEKISGEDALQLMLSVRNLSTHLIATKKQLSDVPQYDCSVCNQYTK